LAAGEGPRRAPRHPICNLCLYVYCFYVCCLCVYCLYAASIHGCQKGHILVPGDCWAGRAPGRAALQAAGVQEGTGVAVRHCTVHGTTQCTAPHSARHYTVHGTTQCTARPAGTGVAVQEQAVCDSPGRPRLGGCSHPGSATKAGGHRAFYSGGLNFAWGSAMPGSRPNTHIQTCSSAKLGSWITRYEDPFYSKWLVQCSAVHIQQGAASP
jgi:hypothetical protein